jgi:xylan 1,4-beta-xylosidase
MSNAENPSGPWSPLYLVEKVEKWEDPCPFWDEDGQAYLGRSRHGAGPIIIHKMSPDGTRLLDEGKTVYTGPVAEGTKILRKTDITTFLFRKAEWEVVGKRYCVQRIYTVLTRRR